MPDIGTADGRPGSVDLAVREPRQQRTREQWERVLDAGVRLLEESGYEGFTIAALCERAEVPPRALYARAASKDALFLAVYERGMARVIASHEAFRERESWSGQDDQRRVEKAVQLLIGIFADNAAFLRAVVLISGAHSEVRRRGEAYRRLTGELFTSALAPIEPSSGREDAARAHEFLFSLVFSVMVVRTAYGTSFGVDGDQAALTRELVIVAQRYLQPGG